MKKRIMALAVAMSLLSAPVVFAHAEDGGPAKRLEKMKTDLNLSDDQANKIKAVFEDSKSRMEAIKKETRERISAILTPEQRVKHKAMMQEHMEKEKHGDKEEGEHQS